MADWSKLPYDLIHKFASYLVAVEDFLAFSAVCCRWRSVYSAKEWLQCPQSPLLILSDRENSGARNFISLYRSKAYNLEIPEAHGRECWGSCSGWILTLGKDLKIRLLNPFTRVSVNLPPQSSLQLESAYVRIPNWCHIIQKAFVFKKPCNEGDFLVMIICSPFNRLAFCRPGYTSWISLKETASIDRFIHVAFAKDQIFALCDMGSLFVIDMDGLAAIDINAPDPPENVSLALFEGKFKQLFLVESSGDLWMVYRNQGKDRCGFPTGQIQFFVYSFDFINKQWIELRDLGNRAIFLGESDCVSVCGPERFNCRSNSIYFVAKDMKNWVRGEIRVDLCVYNMTDRVSETLCFSPGITKHESSPLWVVPTLE